MDGRSADSKNEINLKDLISRINQLVKAFDISKIDDYIQYLNLFKERFIEFDNSNKNSFDTIWAFVGEAKALNARVKTADIEIPKDETAFNKLITQHLVEMGKLNKLKEAYEQFLLIFKNIKRPDYAKSQQNDKLFSLYKAIDQLIIEKNRITSHLTFMEQRLEEESNKLNSNYKFVRSEQYQQQIRAKEETLKKEQEIQQRAKEQKIAEEKQVSDAIFKAFKQQLQDKLKQINPRKDIDLEKLNPYSDVILQLIAFIPDEDQLKKVQKVVNNFFKAAKNEFPNIHDTSKHLGLQNLMSQDEQTLASINLDSNKIKAFAENFNNILENALQAPLLEHLKTKAGNIPYSSFYLQSSTWEKPVKDFLDNNDNFKHINQIGDLVHGIIPQIEANKNELQKKGVSYIYVLALADKPRDKYFEDFLTLIGSEISKRIKMNKTVDAIAGEIVEYFKVLGLNDVHLKSLGLAPDKVYETFKNLINQFYQVIKPIHEKEQQIILKFNEQKATPHKAQPEVKAQPKEAAAAQQRADQEAATRRAAEEAAARGRAQQEAEAAARRAAEAEAARKAAEAEAARNKAQQEEAARRAAEAEAARNKAQQEEAARKAAEEAEAAARNKVQQEAEAAARNKVQQEEAARRAAEEASAAKQKADAEAAARRAAEEAAAAKQKADAEAAARKAATPPMESKDNTQATDARQSPPPVVQPTPTPVAQTTPPPLTSAATRETADWQLVEDEKKATPPPQPTLQTGTIGNNTMSLVKNMLTAVRLNLGNISVEDEQALEKIFTQNLAVLQKLITNLKIQAPQDSKEPDLDIAKSLVGALSPILLGYEPARSYLRNALSLDDTEALQLAAPLNEWLQNKNKKEMSKDIRRMTILSKKGKGIDLFKDKLIFDLTEKLTSDYKSQEDKNAISLFVRSYADLLYSLAIPPGNDEDESTWAAEAVNRIAFILNEVVKKDGENNKKNNENIQLFISNLHMNTEKAKEFEEMIDYYCQAIGPVNPELAEKAAQEKAVAEKKEAEDKAAQLAKKEEAAKQQALEKEKQTAIEAAAKKSQEEQDKLDHAMLKFLNSTTQPGKTRVALQKAILLDKSRLEKIIAWTKQVALERQETNHKALFEKLKSFQSVFDKLSPLLDFYEQLKKQRKQPMLAGDLDRAIKNRFPTLDTSLFENHYENMLIARAQVNEAVRQLSALNKGIYLKETSRGEVEIDLNNPNVAIAFAEKRETFDASLLSNIYQAIASGADPLKAAKGEATAVAKATVDANKPLPSLEFSSPAAPPEPPFTKEQTTATRAGIMRVPAHNFKQEDDANPAQTVVIDKYDAQSQKYVTELFTPPQTTQPYLILTDILMTQLPQYFNETYFPGDMQHRGNVENFFKAYEQKMRILGKDINKDTLTQYLEETRYTDQPAHLLQKGITFSKTISGLASELSKRFQRQNSTQYYSQFETHHFPNNDFIELAYRTVRTHLESTRWNLDLPIQIQAQSEPLLRATILVIEGLGLQINKKISYVNKSTFPTPKLKAPTIKAFKEYFNHSHELDKRLSDIEPARVIDTEFVKRETNQFVSKF